MSTKMSVAREAKARRSRLKRPSKAKVSLLKQVLVKNWLNNQKLPAPMEPEPTTETERSFFLPAGINQIVKWASWPKKSLETIFAAPFEPIEFSFKQDKGSQEEQIPTNSGSLTTLEVADHAAWDQALDEVWIQELTPNSFGGRSEVECEKRGEDQERGLVKYEHTLPPNRLDFPIHGDMIHEEVVKHKDTFHEEVVKHKDTFNEEVVKYKDMFHEEVVKHKDTFHEEAVKHKDTFHEEVVKHTDSVDEYEKEFIKNNPSLEIFVSKY